MSGRMEATPSPLTHEGGGRGGNEFEIARNALWLTLACEEGGRGEDGIEML
jgi:hypothetical protein